MPKGITGFRDDMLNYFSSMSCEELQDEYNKFIETYKATSIISINNDNTDVEFNSKLD